MFMLTKDEFYAVFSNGYAVRAFINTENPMLMRTVELLYSGGMDYSKSEIPDISHISTFFSKDIINQNILGNIDADTFAQFIGWVSTLSHGLLRKFIGTTVYTVGSVYSSSSLINIKEYKIALINRMPALSQTDSFIADNSEVGQKLKNLITNDGDLVVHLDNNKIYTDSMISFIIIDELLKRSEQ